MLIVLAVGAMPPTGDLDATVAHALAHHPLLEASRAGTAAAAAQVRVAGSLPDPSLRWGEMVAAVETRVGPQQRVLSVQQTLPWPGTLGARREAASAGRAAAAALEIDTAVRVAAEVRRAWTRAAWLAEIRSVSRRQLALLRSLLASVRAGYEAGTGRYGDLLQLQLEEARLHDRLLAFDDDETALRARLNAALGRDPADPLVLPAGLPEPPVTSAASVAGHPRLMALGHRAEGARLAARIAQREARPGFTLGLDWIQVGEARMDGVEDSGRDAVVARLGLSLPLWRGKHEGARQAAVARAGALTAERTAWRQALAARLAAAEAALRDAGRRRDLHRDDLLPRAHRVYEAVLAAYRADGTGFADVLAAQRTLLELEQSLLAARRDLLLAAADHDEAAGIVPAVGPTTPRNDS